MPDAPQCPKCGAEIAVELQKAVDDSLERWVAEGLLASEAAAKLRAATPAERPAGARPGRSEEWSALRQKLTPGVILLVVGAIFVLCAVAMVVSSFWSKVGPVGRIASAWAPMAGLYAAGEILRRRPGVSRAVPLIFTFFGALVVPFAAGVLVAEARFPFDICCGVFGQDRREIGQGFFIALISFVAHVATLARYRSPLLTLPVCGSALFVLPAASAWDAPAHDHGAAIFVPLLLTALGMMATGQVAHRRGLAAFAVIPDVIGSFALLLAATALGGIGQGAWEILACAAPPAVIAAGCRPDRQRLLPAGVIFLIVTIFRVGLTYFSGTIGLPITLLVCGLAAIGAGYAIHRIRREYGTR